MKTFPVNGVIFKHEGAALKAYDLLCVGIQQPLELLGIELIG